MESCWFQNIQAKLADSIINSHLFIARYALFITRYIHIDCINIYHLEVLCQSIEELIRSQTIQILHNSVIIENGKLTCLETNCHKVVIFLLT